MSDTRRVHNPKFKFEVALEAAKGGKTVNQLASEYGVHPNQITRWKQKLLKEGTSVFSKDESRELQQQKQQSLEADLYEQIGRLKMELDWLKKKAP
jgi:putative transposase